MSEQSKKAWEKYSEECFKENIIITSFKSFVDGFEAGQKSGHKEGVAEGINLGERHERERILEKLRLSANDGLEIMKLTKQAKEEVPLGWIGRTAIFLRNRVEGELQ